MTLLALSFHGMHLDALHLSWKEQRIWQRQSVENTGRLSSGSNSAFQGEYWRRERAAGGVFLVFDWERREVTWQITVDGVAGFCFHDRLLYLNLMRLDEVIAIDGAGRERRRFSHAHMNNIHTIRPSQRGFLVTSSGTDSILELDYQGNLLYEWCALDHGYQLLPNGQERFLDRSLDQRHHFYSTAYHATHVNSARFRDDQEEFILATLFHQGQVIEIQKYSGMVNTLLDGLDHPHDLRPYKDGWILSNTGANQVLTLDANWQVKQRIELDFNWVQSSAPLHDNGIVTADTNHHRLVRIYFNDQEKIQSYEECPFPANWRIYQVEEVPSEYNDFFRHPIIGSQ